MEEASAILFLRIRRDTMPLTNNDTLRRLRYNLNLNDNKLVEIFSLGDSRLEREMIQAMLKRDDEEGFAECSDAMLSSFLDGLIIKRRGKRTEAPRAPVDPDCPLSNNDILKKLRIALELKEEDVLAIINKTKADITRSELSALFRQKGHKNFKPCGDQYLRNFIAGLKDVYNKPTSSPNAANEEATGVTPPAVS
jgi:uncharacterized protein YehS (DUF1456 family)